MKPLLRIVVLLAMALVVALIVNVDLGDGNRATEIVHPTEENLPRDVITTYTSDLADHGIADSGLVALSASLRLATPIQTIGVVEGTEDEMIGKVEGIVAGSRGSIYMLDSRNNELRMYDRRGILANRFGRTGEGPGEFVAPIGIHLDDKGQLVVVDRIADVKIFERTQNSISLVHSFVLGYDIQGACSLPDGVLISGFRQENERPLNVYTYQGERVRSFGRVYQTESDFIRPQLSVGPVACGSDGSIVLGSFQLLPLVFGYSPRGEELFVAQLDGFQSMLIEEGRTEDGRASLGFRVGPSGFGDVVASIRFIEQDYALVQVLRVSSKSRREGRRYDTIRTYLLSGKTGEGMYVGDELPLVFERSGQILYTGTDAPFPSIVLYELGETVSETSAG